VKVHVPAPDLPAPTSFRVVSIWGELIYVLLPFHLNNNEVMLSYATEVCEALSRCEDKSINMPKPTIVHDSAPKVAREGWEWKG
jgi:hypothetical protein